MRVTALELPARWNSRDQALAQVDALLALGPTDLVLLPEAALTGYVSPWGDFNLRPFAEPLDGPTAQALSSLARRHRTHLVGPLIERDGQRVFNSVVGFSPSGTRVLHYRKRHPWYPETWATAGDLAPPVIEVEGRAVTVAICFDLHFVLEGEWQAELERSDVLLFASAWVEEHDSREATLTALAATRGVAVVNANWGVGEVTVKGQGGSLIISERGEVLAKSEGQLRLDARLA